MNQVYKRRHKPATAGPGAKPAHQRNAAATRAAILVSARQAFAQAGYDGVGVREIAKGAGVTAMLVNRYFGSKECLFAEVAADIMTAPTILTSQHLTSRTRGADMAAALVALTSAGATPLDGFRIMLYSASSARAAAIGREQIEANYHKTLTAALKGPHAAKRAALVLAIVSGVQVMRQMIALPALAGSRPDVLTTLLTPLFDHLLEGTARRSRARRQA